MSIFDKVKKCQSVKVWSKHDMTDEMMDFGLTAFRQYQKGLVNGDVAEYGCLYSNRWYSAYAKKTKGGMCSVCVVNEGLKLD